VFNWEGHFFFVMDGKLLRRGVFFRIGWVKQFGP